MYAFDEMKMDTVFADSVLKNTRSQHVLQKVGFSETHRDEHFVYYRCDRESWTGTATIPQRLPLCFCAISLILVPVRLQTDSHCAVFLFPVDLLQDDFADGLLSSTIANWTRPN